MNELAIPSIDLLRCTRCGNCVSACPASAVKWENGYPVITDREKCSYCGLCEEICPVHAIALSYRIVFADLTTDHQVCIN